MSYSRLLLSTAIIFLTSHSAMAQGGSGKNEVGLNIGGFFYQGDLTPDMNGAFRTARPMGEIYYNRLLSPYFFLRGNIAAGSLLGDDALNTSTPYSQRRKFRFTSPIVELSVFGGFNAFGNNFNDKVSKFSPYLLAGAGVSFLNVSRDWSRTDSSMIHVGAVNYAGFQKDSLATMPRAIPVIPVGLGLKYAFTPSWAVVAEGKYRVTFTDYLDGFSYAANPDRKDGYFSLSIGAVYNFGDGSSSGGGLFKGKNGGSTACPKF